MKINSFVPNEKIFNKIDALNDLNVKNDKKEDFSSFLKSSLDEINEKQIDSDEIAQSMIKGEDVNIHDVTLKAEEAKLSLELAVQIRNKITEAYQELNRMQL